MSRIAIPRDTPAFVPKVAVPRRACACGGIATAVAHACPHAEDVHHDSTPRCHCCAACTRRCAEDI